MNNKEYIVALMDKYKGYIENLEWHLRTNKEHINADEENRINQRIKDYREVVADLKPLS